jgi:peptidyl-tRNA hydrolase
MSELKIYCVVSKEALKAMNGNRGKLAAQAGHAYLHAYWDALERTPELATQYKDSQSAVKITLAVETTKELFELFDLYKKKCGVSLVKDAGRTVFNEPTVTCLGIGPIDPADREETLSNLKMLI